jgi:glycosyltransferase involved in cell wall biosynthesis
MGARRAYELARMLEERGALATLQTSTAWPEGCEPSALYRRLSGIRDGAVQRRRVRGVPARKVRAAIAPEAIGAALGRLGVPNQIRFRIEDRALGFAARLGGLSGANVVLNTTGNGGIGFLRWAQARGARIATDIVITPLAHEIVAEERRRWPGWEAEPGGAREAVRYRRHIERLVAVSDLLLSPAPTVDDGLASVAGFDRDKLVRMPYGLGAARIEAGRPVPRRVLFAGQAGLRKGLPYLAAAARLLRPDGYEIRVAGSVPPSIRARDECADLTFLGHLGPDQTAEEFRTADLFCLPSLAEGMARVTLEAMAAGVPLVVTRSAGAPLTDGLEGMIVPERDGAALADAIRLVAEDRELRARMSVAALETASKHRLEVIGDRLYAVLSELPARHG